jgi:hypothetical protein
MEEIRLVGVWTRVPQWTGVVRGRRGMKVLDPQNGIL